MVMDAQLRLILPDGHSNISRKFLGQYSADSAEIGPLSRARFCIFCRTMGPRAAVI